jgi:hypothetical protein
VSEKPGIEDAAKRGASAGGNGHPTRPQQDPAYVVFAEAHQKTLDAIYRPKTADFVQLAGLRKTYQVMTDAAPPHWGEIVANYFHSALSGWTLADLCVRYAVFRQGPVNQYGRLGGSGLPKAAASPDRKEIERLKRSMRGE